MKVLWRISQRGRGHEPYTLGWWFHRCFNDGCRNLLFAPCMGRVISRAVFPRVGPLMMRLHWTINGRWHFGSAGPLWYRALYDWITQ